MRVLICGSRDWTNEQAIHTELDRLYARYGNDLVIIQGNAPGADTIAARYAALELGIKQEAYRADWHKHGKAAGPIRNQQMLDEGKPQGVVAFQLHNSRGTEDMIRRAKAIGLPVIVYSL